MTSSLVSIYFDIPQLGHTKKTVENVRLLIERLPNFDFFEKDLGIVSPSHFVFNF